MAAAAAEHRERLGSDASEEEEEAWSDVVVTKYRLAADIANTTLQGVISQCKVGASVAAVCKFGDALIEGQCAKSFKSKKVEKGVAFPTTVSVNECVCHYSPYESESISLKENDTVKIDLGVHIDGYIACVAHTIVLGKTDATDAGEVTGPQADVITAAYNAAQACVRTIKPGNKNHDVTEVINKVASAYGVTPIQATLSHQMKRFIIDGNNVIIQREKVDGSEQKVDPFDFEVHTVFALDIAFSTGEGKPKTRDDRTTVYKRALDTNYLLKRKASRYVLNEINRRFATLPFALRAIEDEKQARMGVLELERSDMLHTYPVMYEKEGTHVAHFKFTVMLMPSGTLQVTGLELPENIKSDKTLPEDLASLLAQSSSKSRRRRKKKAAA